MAVQPGMLQPDLARHLRRRDGERARLQETDSRIVLRPLDFGRAADDFLALAHEERELGELLGIETRRAEERARERPLAVHTAQCVILLPERRFFHPPRAIEHIAVGHHFALRDGSAQPRGRVHQHFAARGARQAAARGSSGNERLDQDGHRGVGAIQAVSRHVAERACGPKRRPAGAPRGEEVLVAFDAQVTLELAREARTGPIFDQRRRANHARAPFPGDASPSEEQGLQHFRRDRTLHQAELRIQRAAARAGTVLRGKHSARRFFQSQRTKLHAVGLRVDAQAGGHRQARLHQGGEVRRLRAEPRGIRRLGRAQGNDQPPHRL